MSKPVLFLRCLLLLAALLFTRATYASNFQGGELTYRVVPGIPNRYKLILNVVSDCGGAYLYPTMTFTCRSAGCNAAPNDPAPITAPLIQSEVTLGAPYCTSLWAPPGANQCGTNAPANYQIGRYEVEVTLPPQSRVAYQRGR